MSTGVFLIQDDGQLVEMEEQPYPSEDVLQELLAKYPNLLAGNQIDIDKLENGFSFPEKRLCPLRKWY